MSTFRSTALMLTHPRTDWGGTYADSGTWAGIFRKYGPHKFGLMGAQTFSTQVMTSQVNKPLLWLSAGMGNMYGLRPGHSTYTWKLATDGITRATIVDIDPALPTQPGKGGETFRIALGRGYYHEPVVLKTEGRDQPMLMIVGTPHEETPNKFWYTVVIQDGRENVWVNPAFLQPGKTLTDGTTMVTNELNTKYGGIEIGSYYDLKGQIGYVARKIEVTDRFIRLERDARAQGMAPESSYTFNGKSYSDAVGTGYMVVERNKDGKTTMEMAQCGQFISTAEALLEERIARDKEYQMTFGRNQIVKDNETGYQKTAGAGWLQMSRDGNWKQHSGDITLADFTERLTALTFNSVNPTDRRYYVRTGQDGLQFASRLLEAEAGISPFVFDSSYFIDKVGHNNFGNERAWGAQFTEFRGYNGMRLIFVLDPTKDNPAWYPELHPDTGRPAESGSYDIMDVGQTENAPREAQSKSNIAYIYEPDAELYYNVSNIYDLVNGGIKDGSNAYANNKEMGIYRESSCKLEFWDISRTMRIENTAA